jgi:hypothetical protein
MEGMAQRLQSTAYSYNRTRYSPSVKTMFCRGTLDFFDAEQFVSNKWGQLLFGGTLANEQAEMNLLGFMVWSQYVKTRKKLLECNWIYHSASIEKSSPLADSWAFVRPKSFPPTENTESASEYRIFIRPNYFGSSDNLYRSSFHVHEGVHLIQSNFYRNINNGHPSGMSGASQFSNLLEDEIENLLKDKDALALVNCAYTLQGFAYYIPGIE